jgi:hypothetical protein
VQADRCRHADGQQRNHSAPYQQRDAGRNADAEKMTSERSNGVHGCGQAASNDQNEADVGNRKQKERQTPARTRPPDPRIRGTQDQSPHAI